MQRRRQLQRALKERARELSASTGPALTGAQRAFWNENGFLVLPGFFSTPRIDELNRYFERLWARTEPECPKLVIDVFIGTPKEKRCRFVDAPADARQFPLKLNDTYLESEQVRAALLDPGLTAILRELLGGAPALCNSLNFEFGSQQAFHTDSLYMTPRKKLNMAAAWIALEDCRPEAGPLRYYPGSHRIVPYLFSQGRMSAIAAEMPRYFAYMEREVRRLGLRETRFCARQGDVFIWHSQLFHGGSPIDRPEFTRRSLVSHYFCRADVSAACRPVGEGYYVDRLHPKVPS